MLARFPSSCRRPAYWLRPQPEPPRNVSTDLPTSIEDTTARLLAQDYVADRRLATVVHLALRLQRPLFLEGEPGTGKTEIARTVAAMLGRPLIRLQCYEGLDLAGAAYEWNYARQMLEIRLADAAPGAGRAALATELFGERFLIKRALLDAIDPARAVAPVLLIDELDRADEPFEAFLLEYLGEYQVSIPELGTIRAQAVPVTPLTSNRTRELNDAVKRRCLYHWLDYPDRERELAIVRSRVPGIAESVEWAKALVALDTLAIDPEVVADTAGILFKQREDVAALTADLVTGLLQPEGDAAAAQA